MNPVLSTSLRSSNGAQAVRIIPAEAAERMKSLLSCQSKDVVMDVLGISSNTWMKIKRGEPIRASVAERLTARLDAGASAEMNRAGSLP